MRNQVCNQTGRNCIQIVQKYKRRKEIKNILSETKWSEVDICPLCNRPLQHVYEIVIQLVEISAKQKIPISQITQVLEICVRANLFCSRNTQVIYPLLVKKMKK